MDAMAEIMVFTSIPPNCKGDDWSLRSDIPRRFGESPILGDDPPSPNWRYRINGI